MNYAAACAMATRRCCREMARLLAIAATCRLGLGDPPAAIVDARESVASCVPWSRIIPAAR